MALFVWGHNNAQQLGLGAADRELFDMRQVEALKNEVVVDFSAGERHSLALNEFGHVFAWGRGREGQLGLGDEAGVTSEVPTPRRVGGALSGQLVTKISCGESHSLALTVSGDVFMWGLLPVSKVLYDEDGVAADASDRATVSLAGMSNAELRQLQRARAREDLRQHMNDTIMNRLLRDSMQVYEDMDAVDGKHVTIQTIRAPCTTPRLCTGPLARLIVTNIAAGFAHSLATTSDGAVFSCGYNDNGQLGLGSRHNSAEFQKIKALEGYFIDHIACGQQHSLACSRSIEDGELESDDDPTSRSGVCFSWGLGVLGQLGTGDNISWLPKEVKLARPAVSVAAGSHHSVAVTDDGKVYTWGHSEYGQHGAGETFYDLQQNAHYFFPRLQQALADDPRIHVVRACCSSHSTFALTRDGSVMSWGWNAFGILGNGKYQHSVHPQRVFGLKDNVAVAVGAGSNHCAVAVRPRGCHYSLSYDQVLASGDFADLQFLVGGPIKPERIRAHHVVVCARSSYIKGLLRVLGTISKSDGDSGELVTVDEFQDVDEQVFRAFLLFLYTSRLEIVSHKRKALGQFAARVCCDALVTHCLDSWRKERLDALPPPSYRRRPNQLAGMDPPSSEAQLFGEDMQTMVLSKDHADVVFLWPVADDAGHETFERLPAHKAVLSQVEYFRTMFMGGFSEGKMAREASSTAVSVDASNMTTEGLHEIPLHYMHRDGVSLEAFKGLLLWIYTGCFELLSAKLEPSDMMDLYVGASLLGLTVLASRCELQLVELLPQLDADSLLACEDFAERYDARRLMTMSQKVLRKVSSELSGDEYAS